jgi:hypothetical protein
MIMTQQRRRWTDQDVTKLMSMAQKYPSAQIASEIGRPINSVRSKAHELAISCEWIGTSDRTSLRLTTRNSTLNCRMPAARGSP